jgi:hypothetical protein
MNDELKRYERKRSCPDLMYCTGILSGGDEKSTNNLS